jgi:pimeloyl-ACP methyl ester carboxylesterase
MIDSRIVLTDGRALAFTDTGDTGGFPVFFFHGAPGSRLPLVPLEAEFTELALRVISVDRPGYGGSPPQPGRTMSDWPTDVAQLADALGIERFIVVGHSAGGPYAVACASLLANRVAGTVLLAGVTDMAWPAAWEKFSVTEAAVRRMPDVQSVKAWCEEMYGSDGSRFLSSSGFEPAEPDIVVLSDNKVANATRASFAEAFRQGVGGYAHDIFLQGRAWPFAPGAITTPTMVPHGDLDKVVPVSHSRHTAELIPGAALRVLPGHGHLSICLALPSLCAELIRSLA